MILNTFAINPQEQMLEVLIQTAENWSLPLFRRKGLIYHLANSSGLYCIIKCLPFIREDDARTLLLQCIQGGNFPAFKFLVQKFSKEVKLGHLKCSIKTNRPLFFELIREHLCLDQNTMKDLFIDAVKMRSKQIAYRLFLDQENWKLKREENFLYLKFLVDNYLRLAALQLDSEFVLETFEAMEEKEKRTLWLSI